MLQFSLKRLMVLVSVFCVWFEIIAVTRNAFVVVLPICTALAALIVVQWKSAQLRPWKFLGLCLWATMANAIFFFSAIIFGNFIRSFDMGRQAVKIMAIFAVAQAGCISVASFCMAIVLPLLTSRLAFVVAIANVILLVGFGAALVESKYFR
jgi:hypothetical protein